MLIDKHTITRRALRDYDIYRAAHAVADSVLRSGTQHDAVAAVARHLADMLDATPAACTPAAEEIVSDVVWDLENQIPTCTTPQPTRR